MEHQNRRGLPSDGKPSEPDRRSKPQAAHLRKMWVKHETHLETAEAGKPASVPRQKELYAPARHASLTEHSLKTKFSRKADAKSTSFRQRRQA
jgi:hypothetical protein